MNKFKYFFYILFRFFCSFLMSKSFWNSINHNHIPLNVWSFVNWNAKLPYLFFINHFPTSKCNIYALSSEAWNPSSIQLQWIKLFYRWLPSGHLGGISNFLRCCFYILLHYHIITINYITLLCYLFIWKV